MNTQYNWQYLKNNANTAPPAIKGASLHVPGLQNGQYTVRFYNCGNGELISTVFTSVSGNNLVVSLPEIAWDIAYTVTNNAVLPVTITSFTGQTKGNKNVLTIGMAEAVNVTSVLLERSADGVHFSSIADLASHWNTLTGTHTLYRRSTAYGKQLLPVENIGC